MSRETSPDVVRDVYRTHAVSFFDELRSWFTKEVAMLRKEAEKQLEVDQLKSLRERIEQLEANTMVHVQTSSGDAAAGVTGTSPRSMSPHSRFASEGHTGIDVSTVRSLCREEARRAIEEVRSELLGGDLLCDELLSGGAGLRPALERLFAETPTARRVSTEVAELRTSVDGAAAAATAAATAEIGRLDGAFRSSLAAEVRDLGSLCESTRLRIESLDQSAAEHIGRLNTRLTELEVCSESCRTEGSAAPSFVSAAPSSHCRMDWFAGPEAGEPCHFGDGAETASSMSSGRRECSNNRGHSSCPAEYPPFPSLSRSATPTSLNMDRCSGFAQSGGAARIDSAASLEVALSSRLQPQVLTASSLSTPPLLATPLLATPHAPPAAPALGASMRMPFGHTKEMSYEPPASARGTGPSTPPKRHVPPSNAAAWSSPERNTVGSVSVPPGNNCYTQSARETQKVNSKVATMSPGRREVRGGC